MVLGLVQLRLRILRQLVLIVCRQLLVVAKRHRLLGRLLRVCLLFLLVVIVRLGVESQLGFRSVAYSFLRNLRDPLLV